MSQKSCYLTTFDNPFNPAEDFDSWFNFDIEMGYYSCAYLDRIAHITPDMSEAEKDAEYDRAINEIIKYDFRNIYTKIYADTPPDENEVDESVSIDELIDRVIKARGGRS